LCSSGGGGHYELPHPSSPRGHFSAGAECVISLPKFPALSAAGSGNRRCGGAVLAPAELATVDPHPVQNHGQAPWRPRRWLDVFRAAEPPACPTPSATTISCSG